MEQLSERILVFGGPYSNLEALHAVKGLAEERGFRPKDIICTGDIVGYCANPLECVELIEDWGIHVIAGNVELNLLDQSDDCGCNFAEGGRCDLLSKQWYPFAQAKMTDATLSYISKVLHYKTFLFCGIKLSIIHGSYFNTSEFIFESTPWEIKQKNFDALDSDIILAGHCGLPFADEKDGKLWLNAGVIGMPANDGTSRTWCAELWKDGEGIAYQFLPIEYDHVSAAKKMRDQHLPDAYASTLETGIWDNCEILPEQETSKQGVPLSFF